MLEGVHHHLLILHYQIYLASFDLPPFDHHPRRASQYHHYFHPQRIPIPLPLLHYPVVAVADTQLITSYIRVPLADH